MNRFLIAHSAPELFGSDYQEKALESTLATWESQGPEHGRLVPGLGLPPQNAILLSQITHLSMTGSPGQWKGCPVSSEFQKQILSWDTGSLPILSTQTGTDMHLYRHTVRAGEESLQLTSP